MSTALRVLIDRALLVIGVSLILGTVVFVAGSWGAVALVVLGLAISGLGAWGTGGRLPPRRRVYIGLRSEVEYFIGLVRQLNTHAVEGDEEAMAKVQSAMEASLERIVALAGEDSITEMHWM